ncbi:MAG: DUF4266 domain-containing protein [Campylobacteraceae bacterium]|nr:DUF4266 domain-containing protein [Campylobacteraceae bacterium]
MKNKFIIIISIVLSLTSCSKIVKPWEKNILAENKMQLGGGDSMIKKVNEHVFTSKEASFGGNGIGGGGCGCN